MLYGIGELLEERSIYGGFFIRMPLYQNIGELNLGWLVEMTLGP